MQKDKNNAELLNEIDELKSRIDELEKSEAHCKKVEEELKEREIYQKTIFSAIQTGIVVIDAETKKIIDLNEVAAELIGASKEEIIGHSCHKYICPVEEGKCPIIDLKQTVDHSERILLDINGNEIPILKNVVPVYLGGRECLIESFVDISKNRKAEEALKDSEERIRGIFESSPDSIQVADLAGNLIECNAATLDILGVSSKDEIMGKPVFEFIAPEHRQEAGKQMQKSIKKGSIKHFESALIDKDGHTFPVDVSASVVLDPSGKSTSFIATIIDISERKKAEEAVKRSEEKYRTIVEKFLKISNEIIIELSKK